MPILEKGFSIPLYTLSVNQTLPVNIRINRPTVIESEVKEKEDYESKRRLLEVQLIEERQKQANQQIEITKLRQEDKSLYIVNELNRKQEELQTQVVKERKKQVNQEIMMRSMQNDETHTVIFEEYIKQKKLLEQQVLRERKKQAEQELELKILRENQGKQNSEFEIYRLEQERLRELQLEELRFQLESVQKSAPNDETERERLLKIQIQEQERIRRELEQRLLVQKETRVSQSVIHTVVDNTENEEALKKQMREIEASWAERLRLQNYQLEEEREKQRQLRIQLESLQISGNNDDALRIMESKIIQHDEQNQISLRNKIDEIERIWREKLELQQNQQRRLFEEQREFHSKQQDLLKTQLDQEFNRQRELEIELERLRNFQFTKETLVKSDETNEFQELQLQQMTDQMEFLKEQHEIERIRLIEEHYSQKEILQRQLQSQMEKTNEEKEYITIDQIKNQELIQRAQLEEQKQQIDKIENVWREKFASQRQQQQLTILQQKETYEKQLEILRIEFTNKEKEYLENKSSNEKYIQQELEAELNRMRIALQQKQSEFNELNYKSENALEYQTTQMQEKIRNLKEQHQVDHDKLIQVHLNDQMLLKRQLEEKFELERKGNEGLTLEQFIHQKQIQERLFSEQTLQLDQMEKLWKEKLEQQRFQQVQFTKEQQSIYEHQKNLLIQQLSEERQKQLAVEEQLRVLQSIQHEQTLEFERKQTEQLQQEESERQRMKKQIFDLQELKDIERQNILDEQLRQQQLLSMKMKHEFDSEKEKEESKRNDLQLMYEEQKRKAEEAEQIFREKLRLQKIQQDSLLEEQDRLFRQQQLDLEAQNEQIRQSKIVVPSIKKTTVDYSIVRKNQVDNFNITSLERKKDYFKMMSPEPPKIKYDLNKDNTVHVTQYSSYREPPPPIPFQSKEDEVDAYQRTEIVSRTNLSRASSTNSNFESRMQAIGSPPPTIPHYTSEIQKSANPAINLARKGSVISNSSIVSIESGQTSDVFFNESNIKQNNAKYISTINSNDIYKSEWESIDNDIDDAQTLHNGNHASELPPPPPFPTIAATPTPKVHFIKKDTATDTSFRSQIKAKVEKRQPFNVNKVVEKTNGDKIVIEEALHNKFSEKIPGYRRDSNADIDFNRSTDRPRSVLPKAVIVGDSEILGEDEDDDVPMTNFSPPPDNWSEGITRVILIQDRYMAGLLRIRLENASIKDNAVLHSFLFKVGKFTLNEFKKQKVEKANYNEDEISKMLVEPDNRPLGDHFIQISKSLKTQVAVRQAIYRRFTGRSHVGGEVDGTIKNELKCSMGTSGVVVVLHKTNRLAPAAEFCQQLCEHILKLKPTVLGVQKSVHTIEPDGCLLGQKFLRDTSITIADAARRCQVKIDEFFLFV